MHRSILLPFLMLSLFSMATAQGAGLAELIDTAGTQRMLTQRMMKNYALLGMGIHTGNTQRELRDSVARFDANLERLEKAGLGPEVAQRLAEVKKEWHPIREQLLEPPEKERAAGLHEALDRLMAHSQGVVDALTKKSGSEQGEVVGLAGRQRMLSQRMAALYALSAWRIEDFPFMEKFQETVETFRRAHERLLASELTTPAIRKLLQKTEKSFRWFEYSAARKSDRFIPSLILRASDDILHQMNEATRRYAGG